MEKEPKLPAPVYAPEEVARTILACAEKPVRDVVVGGGGRMMTAMGKMSPRMNDRYMEATMFNAQKRDEMAVSGRRDALYGPMPGSGRERGNYPGHVMGSSLYTRAALNPGMVLVFAALAGVTLALRARSNRPEW